MKNVREFYQELKKLPRTVPLTQDQMELMMAFMMNNDWDRVSQKGDETSKEVFGEFYKGKPFEMAMSILNNRPLVHDFKIAVSYGVVAILGAITESNPGKLVMYMTFLVHWAQENNMEEITLDGFTRMFPMGVWEDDAQHEVWRMQKIPKDEKKGFGDNYIDTQEFWAKD